MDRDEIRKKINSLFDNNQLDDLQRFLKKRRCLNGCNVYMIYLFHLIQSIGILITSYGTSINSTYMIWSGISLNMLASLIQIYEKINNSQLKKLMNDIKTIKDDQYIDESPMVDTDKDLETGGNRVSTTTEKEKDQATPIPFSKPSSSIKSNGNSQITTPLLQPNLSNYQSIDL
jgi:hypothetical protein